jgi:peptide/nickel transport system permease protein
MSAIGLGRRNALELRRPAISRRRAVDLAIVGLLGLVTVVALLGHVLAPYDPIQPTGAPDLGPFSPGHLLGTDDIGRDILSRVLVGIQTSWFSALAVVGVGVLFGGFIGVLAGASGGWIDSLLMRFTDLFLALPAALVAIAIVAALGPSLIHTLIAISVVWWPYYARIIRGEARSLAARPHVEAARLAGARRARLVIRHITPGVVSTAIVAASLDIGNVILTLAGLSFLGLGEPQPAPELGADVANSLDQLIGQYWVAIIPGLAILLLTLIANIGGDAIRRLLGSRPW